MDVTPEPQERPPKPRQRKTLRRMRNDVSVDGNEHADVHLRQRVREYYYIGNSPMNIFNRWPGKNFRLLDLKAISECLKDRLG